MTTAVCFKCGFIKHGAVVPCPKCSGFPQTEDELALSLAMTDHYFDRPTLKKVAASVREGKPPHFDPATHAQLIGQIRRSGMLAQVQGMFGRGATAESPLAERRPFKKPWWRFW
jgi:hypothetical protein